VYCFLGFLNNHQLLAKKTGWQDGKKEETKYSAYEKIWKKREKHSRLAAIVLEIKGALLKNKHF
jgi:hypothetical protein